MRTSSAIFVTLVLVAIARIAHADDFFSSSPGPLSASHGQLDDSNHCNDCHLNGSKDLSNDKCLTCHDHQNLQARIAAGKGFHASAKVKGQPCQQCHHEHKGAGFDIMGWASLPGGEKQFDHERTGWPLRGKHASTDCKDCHKAQSQRQGLRVYMGTDRLCGNCHKNDQPHKFDASEKDKLACERCHGESVWKPAKPSMAFNHDDKKDARMPLLGSHHDVACAKCHTSKYVFHLPFAKPDNCGNSGCHVSPHDGHLFGKRDCEWCHSPTFKTLKQQNFDHTEKTRFDLGPAHSKIKCYDCHTKALGETKPTGKCEQCHAKDSHHGDRFKEFGSPPACGFCHPSGGPKFTPTVFNHGARTKFALTFKHADITCRQCHRGTGPADFENLSALATGNGIDCMGCHQHKKVHDGKWKSNQCTGQNGCHIGPGSIDVKYQNMKQLYHGPNSKFPLVKKHAGVPCEDCHKGRSKAGKTTFEHEDPECGDRCHEDSLHKGTLGDKCTPCHTSGTWDAGNFDHQKPFPDGDSFELKGEHLKNKCEDCHPKRQFKDTPKNCSAEGCHAEDDAHKGRLGDKCERCHVETGDNVFNHNTMSAFRLDGKHLTVRCADCHPSITFKPRPTTCFGCHPEPAVHRGQYGTGCAQCHNTRTWEDIKPLHDVGDFSLKGGHDNIACERCHRDNRPLAGSGNLCINCHRQDDIHNNSLSPRCGECHTQWSFSPARFDHSRAGCNLSGIHRTIDCASCHRNGNYSALAPTCVSCHHDDAVRANAVVPGNGLTHEFETQCATCHSVNTWLGASGNAIGRESVCR
nr:cytochrome c3 family protein [Kofleriaceae bacterium]